jgi:hypothetical protein
MIFLLLAFKLAVLVVNVASSNWFSDLVNWLPNPF